MNVNIPRKSRRNTELADAAPAALDTRRARTVRAPLFSHSKVRRKSAIALMRSVFLQPAGLAAPATAMPACRGWCLQEPPRHQRRAARLRSSWHGLRGCCWPRCGRCGHRAGPCLVALWAHSVSVQRAALWPRQSSASWFVDEYGSRALDNIDSVLGPACDATGTRPLYASESRRGRVCELWAHYGPHPV